jgi:hypothetical protein
VWSKLIIANAMTVAKTIKTDGTNQKLERKFDHVFEIRVYMFY